MLTPRGFWFLIVVGFVTFWSVGPVAYIAPTAAVLSLSLLAWFVAEWALFLFRVNAAAGKISVERHIIQSDRELPNLWANVDGTVRVVVALKPGAWRLPFVSVADKLPLGQKIVAGSRRTVSRLTPDEPITLEYTLHPIAPGVLKFEGVEVRTADLCGLFYRRVFLRIPTEYLVLPTLADDEASQRATKRLNSLPPPGIHRLRRAGGGSELLDLREYRAGDPPKMIAWKASARRDFLITKELENDVPVRCVLFLDASNGMRLGEPGNTSLARAAGIAAAVAQAAAATRDIVGLTVFDEETTTVKKPARTRVHAMQMLRTFAETAGRQPKLASNDADALQRYSMSLVAELYPELLDRQVNSRPFGLYWVPLMDSRAKWLLLLPAAWFGYTYWQSFDNIAEIARNIVRPQNPVHLIPFFGVALGLLYLPIQLATLYWFLFGIRGFFGKRAKKLQERKQLAAVFTALDDDTAAAVERYIHDDEFFIARANRFLSEHHTLPPTDLYDKEGKYRFLGTSKVTVLADTLVRSVGVARDNELYVILADLVELADQLDPLLRAVRAARGRHHQVLVLLPWPEDMPPPRDRREERREPGRRVKMSIGRLIEDALVAEYHRKFDAVRTALVRSGASVIRFNQDDPVKLILQRLEQLRGARIRK